MVFSKDPLWMFASVSATSSDKRVNKDVVGLDGIAPGAGHDLRMIDAVALPRPSSSSRKSHSMKNVKEL